MRTLYVSDLDGTLLNPESRVSEVCRADQRRCEERGSLQCRHGAHTSHREPTA